MTTSVTAVPRPPWTRVARVGLAWLALLTAFSGPSLVIHLVQGVSLNITDRSVIFQDAGVALAFAILFGAISLPIFGFGYRFEAWCGDLARRFGVRLTLVTAAGVAGTAFAGWWWVCKAYPLSLDEFWAMFDAHSLEHGNLFAPIPSPWREYAGALQPMWQLATPGRVEWASTYLPVNAAFLALAGRMGSEALAGPAWAALAVLLTYDIGRSIWPERRDAAVVAALLLATSSQFVVTAMTPYAMSAHLALNLAWLALLLRRTPLAHAAAVAVAFLATGLHQWVFSPLFATPFVAQLWLERRWRAAILHTLAYGAICAFWIAWPTLLFLANGFSLHDAQVARAHGATAGALENAFNLVAPSLMAENILRLTTWQNPLTLPLALFGIIAAFRARSGPLFAIAVGLVLALVVLLLITPFQGHGWGYRYLHGYLGGVCLLAGSAWIDLAAETPPRAGQRAWAVLTLCVACAALVFLPVRAMQARAFISPYAAGMRAISRAPADIVVVDANGGWYAQDLVRNDPFLARRPKVMALQMLAPGQIRDLCARYRVQVFDAVDSARAGLRPYAPPPDPLADARKTAISSPPCRGRVEVAR